MAKTTTNTDLDHQMAAYDEMRETLEAEHRGKWVIFYGGELAGIYDNDEQAAIDAVRRFGYGPCLIREVGNERPVQVPSMWLDDPPNGEGQVVTATTPTDLDHQMAAYDEMREELEADHLGKWVVFHGGELVGIYDNDAAAVTDAGHRFGYGPYLIREVGAGPYRLPPVVEFGLF